MKWIWRGHCSILFNFEREMTKHKGGSPKPGQNETVIYFRVHGWRILSHPSTPGTPCQYEIEYRFVLLIPGLVRMEHKGTLQHLPQNETVTLRSGSG
jgi:hypothetical protein